MPIYSDSNRIFNNDEIYDKMFEDRGVTSIEHYRSKRFPAGFKNLRVRTRQHIWRKHDKFYKLAAEYYNSYDYWWVIAYFNAKPHPGTVIDVITIS